jgi:hypothetical protein
MRKNVASQVVCAQLTSKTDGSAVTAGTTTVYVTGDGGTQASGGGTVTHEGQGCWSYVPTQAETNYNHVAFTFVNTSAVSVTVNVYTVGFDPHGQIPANVTHYGGSAGTFSGGRPEVNSTHFAGTAFASAFFPADVVRISGDSTAADNLESYCDGTTPMPVNATQLSGDATAADNAEAFFDGTGYAGTNNVIPTVTTVTNAVTTTGGLDAAGVRSAVGLASANLDTQLADIATDAASAASGSGALAAAQSEPTSVPAADATPLEKIGWLYTLHRNKRTQNSGTETVYADDGTTVIATSTKTDSAGLFVRGEYTT